MRALTKAIALHGLGIDLWAGEDINGEYEGDGSKKVELTIGVDLSVGRTVVTASL